MTAVFTCLGCGSTLPLTYQSTGAECVWCTTGEAPIVARPEVVFDGGVSREGGHLHGWLIGRPARPDTATAPTATPEAPK